MDWLADTAPLLMLALVQLVLAFGLGAYLLRKNGGDRS